MENVNCSNYYLIKAILASNLKEELKEALVNRLIYSSQSQPFYYGVTTTCPIVKNNSAQEIK